MIRFAISLLFATIATIIVVGTLTRDAVATMIPILVEESSFDASPSRQLDDGVLGSSPSDSTQYVDPVENPPAEDARTRLWRSGATVAALIVGLQRLLMIIIAWPRPTNEPTNAVQRILLWLKTGSRVTYLAAFAGGLAVLIEPASRGTTPSISMAMVAISVVIALLAAPTPAAAVEKTITNGEA